MALRITKTDTDEQSFIYDFELECVKRNRRTSGMTESCGLTALINVVHAPKQGPHADSSTSTYKKKKKTLHIEHT